MGGLDPDFAALLNGKSTSSAPTNSAYDPSAGGGTLQFGPIDTGIATPQWLNRTLAGTGQGLTDVLRHVGNVAGIVSDQDLQDAKQLDQPLLNTTAGRVGQFVGQTAMTAPIGMGAGAALGRMGALGARLAANPLASGTVQGATQGALMADPGQRLQGAAMGSLAGAALPVAGKVIGRAIKGVTRTPAAQVLMDELPPGSLTPGQMNPNGMANRLEQSLEGTPVVGDLVQNARSNAQQQYTRAMIQRSMAPGATLSPKTTDFNAMIGEAAQSFDNAYDAAKGFPVGAKIMNATGPDVPLQQALKTVTTRARPGITPQEQASLGRNLQDLLSQTVKDANQSGGMQSDNLIQLRSTFRTLAQGEAAGDNPSRARRDLYKAAADQVTAALNSQIPTDVAKGLAATDAQYGKFIAVQNAVKAAKDAPGGPTPFQVSSAIANATPKTVYARGGGGNRDLSKAAADTFQNNVPRTGLAGVGRLAIPLAAGYLAKGAALSHPVTAALMASPLAAQTALTLTRGGRMLAGGQTGIQQALQQGLLGLQGAIPSQVQNLPGLYGRSALQGLLAPRLQQLPAQ